MIKAKATINGVISRQAAMRTTSDGKPFISFTLRVNVPASRNNMAGKDIFIYVSKQGGEEELSALAVGNRVMATGTLTFKKTAKELYLNLRAESVTVNPEATTDSIEGTMEFKGKIGNKVEVKTDKNGYPYVVFSAFSTEKQGDKFHFTWVRFRWFEHDEEPFLQPKQKVQATGKLIVSIYNDSVTLDCRVDDATPWESQTANENY